jgi:hypothetical protein
MTTLTALPPVRLAVPVPRPVVELMELYDPLAVAAAMEPNSVATRDAHSVILV